VWPVDLFNPVQLDTDQWVRTAKSFGAKYYVLVADHFSGFSLYPTKANNYSVAHTAWRNGTADIVKEFVASCKKYGVRPAFYYSTHQVSSGQRSTPHTSRPYMCFFLELELQGLRFQRDVW
jgi:alpha-L-fucosidase